MNNLTDIIKISRFLTVIIGKLHIYCGTNMTRIC